MDISGSGGHSVFNIYLDISGMGGHGGTDAFNTHLLGSGSGHVGHGGHFGRSGAGGAGHGHGRGFTQRSQTVPADKSTNDSIFLRFPYINPT